MDFSNVTCLIQNNGNCSQSMTKKIIGKDQICLGKNYLNSCDAVNNETTYTNGILPRKLNINEIKNFKFDSNNVLTKPFQFNLSVPSLPRRNLFQKEKSENGNILPKSTFKNSDRQMPKLTKENETDIKANLLSNSAILNQRYQNVLRFPNYRQRKKCAFEKKLKHCGVELDGEVAIANLRKILQPYIYQEINNVIDKYIEVYFKKAIKHIQENVNLTSETWSETLRCSISKSLYKQYCDIANVNPFTSSSINEDDFPYFKASPKIIHKTSNISADYSCKSEMENSTGHTSDSNSRCSYLTVSEDKIEIDHDLNMEEASSSSEHISECIANQRTFDNHIRRKRKNHQYFDSSQKYSKFSENCSFRKYPKIIYPTQSYSNNSYVSHYSNNPDSFIYQEVKESKTLSTAGFENCGQPYFLNRKPREHSLNKSDAGNYLNTHNSMTTNIANDHVYPKNYHCRNL